MVVVHSDDKTATDPAFQAVVAATQQALKADRRVEGGRRAAAGHVDLARRPHRDHAGRRRRRRQRRWCAPPTTSRRELASSPGRRRAGLADRRLGHVVGLQRGQPHGDDEVRADLSWPVTIGILVLAFGSLVAAGLPLMLTILGLVASAGSLYLGTQVLDISIWAMNFALMFALALGIDYALFIVDALPRRAASAPSCRSRTPSPRRWTPPARPSCSAA